MIVKLIIVIAFFTILYFLGSALFQMVKHKDKPEQMLKALSLRVGLSVVLFIFLIIAIATGIITPHGLGPSEQQKVQMQKAE